MPALIHRLTGASRYAGMAILCGSAQAEIATWDPARVSCEVCLSKGLSAPARQQKEPALPRTPRSGPTAERELQETVRKAALLGGWKYFHAWNSQHSPAGYPDTTLVKGDRLIFAELKARGKAPTPAQQEWLAALAQVREIAVYTWTEDDVAAMLTLLLE